MNKAVQDKMNEFSELQRMVIKARLRGLKYSEIAEMCNVNKNAAKLIFHYASKRSDFDELKRKTK